MFCFIRFLIDIKSPLTPELYFKIYIEMSRQALLYTAISALRPWGTSPLATIAGPCLAGVVFGSSRAFTRFFL